MANMDDAPPYYLEIDGLDDPGRGDPLYARPGGRPWVGVRFECCRVYSRVYRNREGTAYRGKCPRCLRMVTLRVGPDGTDARFFAAE